MKENTSVTIYLKESNFIASIIHILDLSTRFTEVKYKKDRELSTVRLSFSEYTESVI